MDVEIPKRALFKSSEVCEIASVQPYVLRSWESEFPDLGAKGNGDSRVYRRADVERVLRIKQWVFADGLTLAGVRRRIDEEAPPVLEEAEPVPVKASLGRNVREQLGDIKKGLRGILDLLGDRPSEAQVRRFAGKVARPPARVKAAARRAKPAGRSKKRSGRR